MIRCGYCLKYSGRVAMVNVTSRGKQHFSYAHLDCIDRWKQSADVRPVAGEPFIELPPRLTYAQRRAMKHTTQEGIHNSTMLVHPHGFPHISRYKVGRNYVKSSSEK